MVNRVLHTTSGQHIGFMLFVKKTDHAGDCVFIIVPQNQATLDLPEVQYLYQLKLDGEHQWHSDGLGAKISRDGRHVAQISNDGFLISSDGRHKVRAGPLDPNAGDTKSA